MKKNELRVLLISPLPPPTGGIASWTSQYITWCKSNNIKVDIVNTALIGQRCLKINSKKNFIDEIKRTKIIISELKYKIFQFDPSVIHLNTPCGKLGIIRDYLCARLIKKQKNKLIIHYRCNIEDQIGKFIFQKYFFKKIALIADKNLVLNKMSKDFLFKQTNQDSIVISNFLGKIELCHKPKLINSKIKNIIFVGHVQRTKGIFDIIEIANYFPEIKFIIVGPISREVDKIQIPTNIKLTGVQNKEYVYKLLSDSDVFLFPSFTEGFSNALLEAMAIGLPIIATDVGANFSMLENKGGIMIDISDKTQLVKALFSIKSKEKREDMSSWNQNKVLKSYTINKVMKELLEIYKE